mgnify:CR=1 FL=1
MTTVPLVVGIAWIIQAILIYWAYGLPQDFTRDGTHRSFALGDRPEAIRGVARVIRRFAIGATILILGGIVLVVLAIAGVRP